MFSFLHLFSPSLLPTSPLTEFKTPKATQAAVEFSRPLGQHPEIPRMKTKARNRKPLRDFERGVNPTGEKDALREWN